MNENLQSDLILMLNGLVIELKKLNDNLERMTNVITDAEEQINELGYEIYKARQELLQGKYSISI